MGQLSKVTPTATSTTAQNQDNGEEDLVVEAFENALENGADPDHALEEAVNST